MAYEEENCCCYCYCCFFLSRAYKKKISHEYRAELQPTGSNSSMIQTSQQETPGQKIPSSFKSSYLTNTSNMTEIEQIIIGYIRYIQVNYKIQKSQT